MLPKKNSVDESWHWVISVVIFSDLAGNSRIIGYITSHVSNVFDCLQDEHFQEGLYYWVIFTGWKVNRGLSKSRTLARLKLTSGVFLSARLIFSRPWRSPLLAYPIRARLVIEDAVTANSAPFLALIFKDGLICTEKLGDRKKWCLNWKVKRWYSFKISPWFSAMLFLIGKSCWSIRSLDHVFTVVRFLRQFSVTPIG